MVPKTLNVLEEICRSEAVETAEGYRIRCREIQIQVNLRERKTKVCKADSYVCFDPSVAFESVANIDAKAAEFTFSDLYNGYLTAIFRDAVEIAIAKDLSRIAIKGVQ